LVLQQQNCGSRGDDGHRKGDAGRQDTDCRRHAANVRAGFDRVPDDNAYECRAQEPRRMMIADDFEQPFAGDGRFAALPPSCAMQRVRHGTFQEGNGQADILSPP
jgi:hypothetical protein